MGLKESEYAIEGEEDDEFNLEDFQDNLEWRPYLRLKVL